MFPIQSTTDDSKVYTNDVFSTYLYTGNGLSQTLTDGIDRTQGALDIFKSRSAATDWALYDSVRGVQKDLVSNSTAAETTQVQGVTATSSTSITIGSLAKINTSGVAYVKTTFRTGDNFFTETSVNHTSGTNSTVNVANMASVGMVIAKITTTTGNWFVWHNSLTAGNNLRLNATTAQGATSAWLSVSGTTITLSSSATTGTYMFYVFSHDTTANGNIRCGSYTGNGTLPGPSVSLNWEPQFLLIKAISSSGSWYIFDDMRSLTSYSTNVYNMSPKISMESAAAESSDTGLVSATSTGFNIPSNSALVNSNGVVYAYVAVRINNKPPMSATEVFAPVVYTGTNTDNRLVSTGIKTDLAWFRQRDGSGAGYEGFLVGNRLSGNGWIKTGSTQLETINIDGLDQELISSVEYGTPFSSMNGVWVGNNSGATTDSANINSSTTSNNYIIEAFRRAPGFCDVVCYTGNGTVQNVPHQLGVVPELISIHARSGPDSWYTYTSVTGPTGGVNFNLTNGFTVDSTWFNNTAPTNTYFTVGSLAGVNYPNSTFLALLFASYAGISKIGSYAGNNSSQTINCGFSSGARFVMIKGKTGGNWWIFDTARGVTAAADPVLTLNTTDAELTTIDAVDSDSTGFIVNQEATCSINNTGITYIYFAIA